MTIALSKKHFWFFLFLSFGLPCPGAEPLVEDVRIGGTRAYVVRPGNGTGNVTGKGPGILFVHWLEPRAPDSNRTQFLAQALELARDGVTSVLPETMWSDPEWFNRRDPARDYEASLEQVEKLRACLDWLLAQPAVDGERVGYVGHDFGMMYGLLLAKDERRVKAWALQAGTADFADWFLLGRARLPEADKRQVRERLAPLAPVKFIGLLRAPVLLQFGEQDPFVPRARAEQLANAAQSPKQVRYYRAGHGLNAEAVEDRMAWLRLTLGLPAARH